MPEGVPEQLLEGGGLVRGAPGLGALQCAQGRPGHLAQEVGRARSSGDAFTNELLRLGEADGPACGLLRAACAQQQRRQQRGYDQ